jgi:hypothetical protein
MIESAELLIDAFDRVRDVVHADVEGLTPVQLEFRIDDTANSIAWLVWHLTRIQDDHVADVAGEQQVWTSQGWAQRLRLPFDDSATGYGHGPDEVAAVRVNPGDLLVAYHDAVHEQTRRYLQRLTPNELGRIVDDSWEPPVSLGVRLVSVLSDDLQHAGQAALVRGVGQRRRWRRP